MRTANCPDKRLVHQHPATGPEAKRAASITEPDLAARPLAAVSFVATSNTNLKA
jgi:hypothetical protein